MQRYQGDLGSISNYKKRGNSISALNCATAWHRQVQNWKLIVLLDVVEFTVR